MSLARLTPNKQGLHAAARIIRDGGLVAIPTETVYGLAANAERREAVAKLYAVKHRPPTNPLIIHIADVARIRSLAQLNDAGLALADAFWPGPLTLITHPTPGHAIAPACLAEARTMAVRCPYNLVAARLLATCDCPLAAPSANLSGHVSPTTAEHVIADLGDSIDAILDDGPCPLGLESTIIDVTGERPLLRREGAIPLATLTAIIGPIDRAADHQSHATPGSAASHYAPHSQLRLNATTPAEHEVWLGFGPQAAQARFNLSPGANLDEAAANLYAMLRAADRHARQRGTLQIAVSPLPTQGIGAALNDRLRRAAAPRPPHSGNPATRRQ